MFKCRLSRITIIALFFIMTLLYSCSEDSTTEEVLLGKFNDLVEQADKIRGYGKFQVAGARGEKGAVFMILNSKTGEYAIWMPDKPLTGTFQDLRGESEETDASQDG